MGAYKVVENGRYIYIDEKATYVPYPHPDDIEYLMGYLEERNMNYDQFIENLAKPKGLTAMFFAKMKKMFS